MLGLVGATFTYLVVLFECLLGLLSMMWFIYAAWFRTKKERKKASLR